MFQGFPWTLDLVLGPVFKTNLFLLKTFYTNSSAMFKGQSYQTLSKFEVATVYLCIYRYKKLFTKSSESQNIPGGHLPAQS